MTTGSNPNLSLASPYSFTITQSAATPATINWVINWGNQNGRAWGAFKSAPTGSNIQYIITPEDSMTFDYVASTGPRVNTGGSSSVLTNVPAGGTLLFYYNNNGSSWGYIGSLTVPSSNRTDAL